MNDCIFCKIIRGEIPAVKIWENEEFMAFLDLFPNTEGMSLVIPKKHYNSYVFDMPDEDYKKLMLISKKVAQMIEKGLNVRRVAMVAEGMGVNHVHIKLYPMHGLEEEFKSIDVKEDIFFEKYPGFITTKMGPQKDIEELKQLAEKIRQHL